MSRVRAPRNLDDFREFVRGQLADHLPRRSEGDHSPEEDRDHRRHRELQGRLHAAGLAGLMYPEEYGGQGLGREHQVIFNEEARDYEMPLMFAVTLGIIGPTLLDRGTEAQKLAHIPRMLSGDAMWVQFLSEPGAGSDLAATATTAARDGGQYILRGSKIWSTGAQFADFSLCLVRTDWDLPKHRGLSMLILPIDHPGVTVEPIALVNRDARFCQEFIDDAAVPVDNLVGSENDGWSVALELLQHERNMVGGNSLDGGLLRERQSGQDSLTQILAAAAQLGAGAPVAEQLVGEAVTLARLGPLLAAHLRVEVAAGRLSGQSASMLKLFSSTTEYRQREIGFRLARGRALFSADWDEDPKVAVNWVGARARTIAGGTNEMQRNVIAERVLGLPRDVAIDRDVAFRDVRRN